MRKVLLFFVLSAAFISAQNLSSLLPDSIEGWSAPDSSELYVGEDLFRLINGGADIFLEYGFIKVLTQRYIGAEDKLISTEIYEMKDSSAAFGIFSLFTFRTGKRIEFNTDAFAGDGFLLFQKGKYYVSLSGNESSERIQNGLIKIGEFIEKNIEQAGKPYLVSIFDQLNYSRIAFIKGNLGLYNLSNIDFGKSIRVEEGVCIKEDSSINFVLMYGSEEECAENYSALISRLKNKSDFSFINSEGSSYFFKSSVEQYYLITSHLEYIITSISADLNKTSEAVKKIIQVLE
ncbi:MAG: DUF6599 family protein [Ignavibacteria bacterium]